MYMKMVQRWFIIMFKHTIEGIAGLFIYRIMMAGHGGYYTTRNPFLHKLSVT